MSLRSYETRDGTRWQVQWRDHHKKLRGRTFTSKTAALAFDADVKARKFKGEVIARPAKQSLAAAYDEWYRLRGENLAPATKAAYKSLWNAHVADRFDGHSLQELATDPQLFEELIADMRERGVGAAAQRKVLVVMSAVLTAAVDWNKIATNPLWRMRKPAAPRQHHPHPFPPFIIERIRLLLGERLTKSDPQGRRAWADACLVQLMAYAGLRPGEALALTWGDIGENSIAVDKAVRDGTIGPTKTGTIRSAPLVRPLNDDLRILQTKAYLDERRADNRHLVFPTRDENLWSRADFNNWRNRVWKPALEALASSVASQPQLATARPYDCRGSFVSLQLRAGVSPLEVAEWCGHSPAVMFRHYANVINELRGEPIVSAEKQIERARELVYRSTTEQLDRLTADLLQRPSGNNLDGTPPPGYSGFGLTGLVLHGQQDWIDNPDVVHQVQHAAQH